MFAVTYPIYQCYVIPSVAQRFECNPDGNITVFQWANSDNCDGIIFNSANLAQMKTDVLPMCTRNSKTYQCAFKLINQYRRNLNGSCIKNGENSLIVSIHVLINYCIPVQGGWVYSV